MNIPIVLQDNKDEERREEKRRETRDPREKVTGIDWETREKSDEGRTHHTFATSEPGILAPPPRSASFIQEFASMPLDSGCLFIQEFYAYSECVCLSRNFIRPIYCLSRNIALSHFLTVTHFLSCSCCCCVVAACVAEYENETRTCVGWEVQSWKTQILRLLIRLSKINKIGSLLLRTTFYEVQEVGEIESSWGFILSIDCTESQREKGCLHLYILTEERPRYVSNRSKYRSVESVERKDRQ